MTVYEAKNRAAKELVNSPSAQLDAQVLLSHVTGLDKTAILFNRNRELSLSEQKTFDTYIAMRKTGLPVAYITGHKEFFGYDFFVTPDVLIPKPDTEILVEETLLVLNEKLNSGRLLTVCDMCTGSGCVGISVIKSAFEKKLFTAQDAPLMVLADISEKALSVAQKNVTALCPSLPQEAFRLVRTNLFENVSGSFDIICTNPPYVPAVEARKLLQDGRSEPLLALDGDIDITGSPTGYNDGLGVIKNLVPQAKSHLAPHGVLLMETGEYNAEMAEWILKNEGFKNTKIICDLEGQLRVVKGEA